MNKQRQHMNLSRIMAFVLSVAMLAGFCPPGVSLADIPVTLPKVQAASISNPRIVKDSSMDAGQKVTWDCVYFGSYPQSEVTSKDGSIYNALKNATGWDSNNDITIGGTKYRRLKGEDATYTTSGRDAYYNWNSNKTYHYFKYEPIKWRVLNRNGNDALLLADIALDDQEYNTSYEAVTWESSSMRSWLNGYGASVNQPKTDYSRKNFINSAFTSTQRNAIKTTNVVNNNNIGYGTAGGNNTSDKVFLLSESEVYNTDTAASYGFVKDDNTDDEARRSRCSTYAYAMGTWRYVHEYEDDNDNPKYNGNIWWWLRSPGDYSNFAAVVCCSGWVDRDGYAVGYENGGVRPALHLNLSSSNLYSYAGTVCSDAMKNGESGSDNPVNPGKPDTPGEPDTPQQPAKPGTATGDRTEESKVDIKMEDGIKFTIPDTVPIIGGGDISLDYGAIPITFQREDNTFRLGIGVQNMNKNDWVTFRKFVETQKESYRKGINSLLASKKGLASMGMKAEPEMNCFGYVEGTITKSKGVESVGGKMFVEIKGTAKNEWQTLVVVVPVVIKAKGTVGATADFSVGLDMSKSRVYTEGEVEMTLPGIRLSGGVGVSYIADISVYGEAKNIVKIEADGKNKNDVTGSLDGALGVSAKALCFSYEKELLNGSWEYFSTKKGSGSGAWRARMYSGSLAKEEPKAKDYEINRVASSSWNGSATATQKAKSRAAARSGLSAQSASGAVQTLQKNVYASAKPQLLQTESGKKVLIYTTDVAGRTTGNHTAAVYSIYNEQSKTWSTPAVIEEDGTADFDVVAAIDGENVYVAWVNAKRTFTQAEAEADDFMTKLAASTEIHAAKTTVNNAVGTVTKYASVTENAIADLHPSVAVKNHVPYIAWNSNSANDILKGTGTNSIYLASLNGNTFTAKKLTEEKKPVQSVAAGVLEDNMTVAYTINSGTQESPQVQLAAVDADTDNRQTIASNGQNLSPSFVTIDGTPILLWYAQEEAGTYFHYVDSLVGDVENYIEDGAVISSDYTIVDGEDSQLLACAADKEDTEEAGRNLYAYIIQDGEVSEPVTLTDLEGYTATPSGIWNGNSYEYLFTRTDVTIADDVVEESSDLCVTSVVPKSSLVIGDIDYTQEELMPEEEAELTVPVKNNGLSYCADGKVQIVRNGTVIGEADLEDGLAAGETQNITVSLTVPETAASKETLKVEAVSGDNTTADSTKSITSAGSELSLSVEPDEDDPEESLTVTAKNTSAFDTNATLTLRAGDAAGKVVKTINLGTVEAYDKIYKTFTKEELRTFGSDTVYMEVSGDSEESVKSDNSAFVYVGKEELKTLDYLTATKKKVTYQKGEKLSLADLEVTAVYTDGTKEKVTGYTTNEKNIDMSKTGQKQLEILYEEVGIGRKVIMPITVENKKADTKPKPSKPGQPTKKIKVSSVRLSAISKQIAAGKKVTLKPTVLPANASNKKLTWKSSNTKVAAVTQGGVVTLKKKTGGKKVTITATATDGSRKSASWQITSMKGIVKKVKITGSKSVKAGKKLKLKAKVTATKKANTKLRWTSGNTKYATVNAKGIVKTKKTAKGKSVKITAMATDGSGKKQSVKIKIKK